MSPPPQGEGEEVSGEPETGEVPEEPESAPQGENREVLVHTRTGRAVKPRVDPDFDYS